MTDPHSIEVPSIFTDTAHDRLVAMCEAQRAVLEGLLTPEALAALDAAEQEAERKALEGDDD